MSVMAVCWATPQLAAMARKPYKKAKERHPGHYIREWRAHRGLSQERVAERVEMSVPQVSKIENWLQGYRQGTLERFAEAFGVEAPMLLRPPHAPENEIAAYVMKMDASRRAQAMRLLRALSEDQAA